jgi:magnesium transporter
MRALHVLPSGELRTMPDLPSALAARGSQGYLWLDFEAPSRVELEALVGPLGLHPLWVEDCLDEAQVPKIDIFPGGTFLLFNSYAYAGGKLSVGEIDFILGKDFLVTLSGHGGPGQSFHERLSDRLRVESEILRQGPDFLLHLLLDDVVDEKYKAIEALQGVLDGAEEDILKSPSGFRLARLFDLRRHLLYLHKSLFHEREILTKVCRRDSPYIGEKAIYHFRDIYDHLTRYFEEVEICREMHMSLMEMYLSMINNRMAQTANRTNDSVRRLTLITTIFMPLSFLAGVGGMSEWTMMTGAGNWKLAYPAFMALTALAGAVTYFVLRRLEKRDPKLLSR